MGLFDKVRRAKETAEKLAGALGFGEDQEVPDDVPRPPPAPRPAFGVPRQPEAVAELGRADIAAQVFGDAGCPWTARAVRLLDDRGIEHEHIDLDDPDGAKYRPYLIADTKQHTVPYIYVRGTFIGGYDALDELDRLGQLEERTKPLDEQGGTNAAGIRIEVATRQGDGPREGEKDR